MTALWRNTLGVPSVYIMAFLSLYLQVTLVFGDPAPQFSGHTPQSIEWGLWSVVGALSITMLMLIFNFFKSNRLTAGWASMPAALISLLFPISLAVFSLWNLINAFHQ
jgi:hypothetical protein